MHDKDRTHVKSATIVSEQVTDLAALLQDDGILSLLKTLRENFTKWNVSPPTAGHLPIILPASAYVSGIQTPTLDAPATGTSVFVEKGSYPVSYRVVEKTSSTGLTGSARTR